MSYQSIRLGLRVAFAQISSPLRHHILPSVLPLPTFCVSDVKGPFILILGRSVGRSVSELLPPALRRGQCHCFGALSALPSSASLMCVRLRGSFTLTDPKKHCTTTQLDANRTTAASTGLSPARTQRLSEIVARFQVATNGSTVNKKVWCHITNHGKSLVPCDLD